MKSASLPLGLHFINTSHPKDATTSDTLRQIRSHAAREIRYRARKSAKHTALASVGKRDRNHAKAEHTRICGKQGTSKRACFASAINTNQGDSELHATTMVSSLSGFRPLQDARLSRPSTCWSSARPFSDVENFLLAHYINHVVPFLMGSCHRNKAPNLVAIQMTYWVPFALSDIGLIAAIFLQSCRSLETLTESRGYADLSTEYRLQCIQSTNASLSTKAMQISDATIAKAMIMASDEFTLGNVEGWNAHFAAITHMIAMRGGVDTLGVGGLLKDIIVNTPMCYGY